MEPIRPQELRLGNLVTVFGIDRPLIVNALLRATIELKDEDNTPECYYYTSTTGIPISEEWLLKLGFEETYKSEFTQKFDLSCNAIFGYSFKLVDQAATYRGQSLKCNYVHQLQNLYFALTGSELELKQLV